jgi:Tol biopolymer transport system component
MNFNDIIRNIICWISFIGILFFGIGCSATPEGRIDIQSVNRAAIVEPEYSDITIPPNIAPLNFSVKESGQDFFVRIQSNHGDPIRIHNSDGNIQIPLDSWKHLLAENIGQLVTTDIFIRNQTGGWMQYHSMVNQISQDSIDSYLTYRKFGSIYNLFKKMGIYQRCLENFMEKPVLVNKLTQDNCMNCHNFYQNKTDRWLMHLRGGPGTSMLLVTDGKAKKIDLKTKFNGPAAYPAWHPSGELIAFSVSKLRLFFHEIGECRDVLDLTSDIILYDIPTNTVTTTPEISSPDRMEIWPAWSPDGRYLYFCSAPKIETFENPDKTGDLAYDSIKYDLIRIAYDPVQRSWGKLETVISACESGLSITEPRISPDGHFLLFTGAAYSQFPIYLHTADIYILDLRTGRWKKSEVNSDRADSFHSWSSNGRWIVFSSKRQDDIFTKLYLSHIDSLGCASKPFVLPQENPLSQDYSLNVYNVPEFTKESVHISPQALAKAAFSQKEEMVVAKLDPSVLLNRTENKSKPVVLNDISKNKISNRKLSK